MTEIRLERRSTPDRLRHLAAKLREGETDPGALAFALEVTADEIEQRHTASDDPRGHGKWEYGQLYSGGGYLTFNESTAVERIHPLTDRLRAGMRDGGRVYRRRIIVVSGWEEMTLADADALGAPGHG